MFENWTIFSWCGLVLMVLLIAALIWRIITKNNASSKSVFAVSVVSTVLFAIDTVSDAFQGKAYWKSGLIITVMFLAFTIQWRKNILK